MATSLPSEELGGAAGGADKIDDDETNFNTPPESMDDLRLDLSPDVDDNMGSTEDYIKKNQEWIAKSAESVKELKATMDKLIGQASSRKAELQSRTDKIKQMKKEIDEVSTEAIEKEEEELKKLIDVETGRHNQMNGETSESDTSNADEGTLHELKMKVEAYKEHLGLQINVSSQDKWVEFIFTDIDAQSTESTFCIKLAVEGECYKCVSCQPHVAKIEDLFEQLNTHHDLQQFMVELRTEFQAIVNKEN